MKTAIRLDDITPDMNYENFTRVKTILDNARIKPLIGVVPYSKDSTLRCETPREDFPELISELQKQGWVVALHGYNHLYTTENKGIFPLNSFSEFAGVELDKQDVMIREGKLQLLEWGVTPKVFMAPGHSFDRNTLTALKNNGIYALTDGFGQKPYKRDGITFYPISRKRSECTSGMEGYSTYVLHTNTMNDKQINQFEAMIINNRDCFIDYSELMTVEPDNRGMMGNLSEYLQAFAKHILVSSRASKGTVIHKQ